MSSGVKFWKPGTSLPNSDRKDEGEGAGSFLPYNPHISLSIQQQRQRLPVFQHRNQILHLIEKYQTLVVVGETGSGKSTQIPQYLYECGWTDERHIIGVVQPRRVAATSVANRVAEEMGSYVGQLVGYAIRFENLVDDDLTKIKFMTDGYLLREMMSDPLLLKYSVIMIDEAHERTLSTDIALGLLKKIIRKRPDLRLVISSATLNAQEFKDFFEMRKMLNKKADTATILSVEGRTYPVEVFFLQNPTPNYVKAAVETVLSIHKSEPDGDVLVFLTGQDEVENAVQMITDGLRELKKSAESLLVLPMYGGLPMSEQMRVFQRTPSGKRKVVVSTNIAEASITINGIVYVVDCGFVKLKAYNADSGLESLVIVPASQASSNQRSGRAGRVRSGKAYRLYPQEEFESLQSFTCPEMQRSNLAPVILHLKALGIDNVVRFSFFSRPPSKCLMQAYEVLYALGALDDNGDLTSPLGQRMSEYPLDPMLSKMLLSSEQFECSNEIVTIAAMLQVENVFVQPSNKKKAMQLAKQKFSTVEGDHLTFLNVYNAFIRYKKDKRWCHENFLNYQTLCRVEKIRQQIIHLLKKHNIPLTSSDDDENIRKCIVSGFFANAAYYHPSGEYRTIRYNYPLHIHPTSVLVTEVPPKYVVFHQVLCTSRDFMRDITVIEGRWLTELAPHFYDFGTDREIAAKRARVDNL